MARKILLADDSVTAQNMGRKILADAGYEVIAVNNGSAALKKIAELKPDLVILDVYMPGYSGLEVCQRLKESSETARIPVLLSVGKLEPFKPEEAKRVRADAFIVKPFEASELLSALSKLEDKVVPQPEPSKPGRFARAIAAAEESSRGSRSESGAENGWKSRIGFPQAKPEDQGKVADEASIYNPINRDLRTVVDKSADETLQGEKSAEASFNAAPVPPNILNDVTPEEVAAIAAAVAQMQMAAAADFGQPVPVEPESKPDVSESKIENAVETAVPEVAVVNPAALENEQPVTMAAASGVESAATPDASRWTAVSVALDSEETAVSLEQEMRQAYAAFAAPEPDNAASFTPAVAALEPDAADKSSASSSPALAAMESPGAVISIAESEPITPVANEESVVSSVHSPVADPVALTAVVAERAPLPEPSASHGPVAEKVSATATDTLPVEATADNAATVAPVETNQEPPPVASVDPIVTEAQVVTAPQAHQELPAPEAEPAIAMAASVNGHTTTGYAQILHRAEHEADPKPESEVVKSTAAAWASWRQGRDTSDTKDTTGTVAEAKLPAAEVPESAQVAESAAMAVAAGAEQTAQDGATAVPAENPADVASIVDSVLADLRPRLMAEISRKMSEKK